MTAVASADTALSEHADAIRALGKQTVANIIEIGRRLVDCRENHLDHGEWLPWLKREFDWSRQTADRFIHVFEAADKLPKLSNLEVPISGLYLLTAPSASPEARDEIIERAEAGEKMPLAEVKRVIARKGWPRERYQRLRAKRRGKARAPAENKEGFEADDNFLQDNGDYSPVDMAAGRAARTRGFLYRAQQSVFAAEAEKFVDLEITKEMLAATRKVVQAWTKTLKRMESKGESPPRRGGARATRRGNPFPPRRQRNGSQSM